MKKRLYGVLSLMLAFAVFFTFQFAFVQQASAASQKYYYALVQTNEKITSSEGSKYTYKSSSTYNSKGLMTSQTYTDGKQVFKYNKKNLKISQKTYNNGKLIDTRTFEYKYNKKGAPLTCKEYVKSGGKKTLVRTTTYTYYSNKNYKKVVTKEKENGATSTNYYTRNGKLKKAEFNNPKEGDKSTSYCRSNGTIRKIVSSNEKQGYKSTTLFNKYGDVISDVSKSKDYSYNTKYTLKYKNGRVVKETGITKGENNGNKYTEKSTREISYKVDSHNNVTKETTKYRSTNGDYTYSSKTVATYKYKKVRVPKRGW